MQIHPRSWFLDQGFVLGLSLVLASFALAQDDLRPPVSGGQTLLPDGSVVASDPPGLLAPPPEAPGPLALNSDGGAVPIVDVALPDEVALPVPARFVAGPDGDQLLAPASGGPWFLGFSAGPYYPPEGERLDPRLTQQVVLAPGDGRPEPTSYGYVMLGKRITPARVAAIEALGCRVLGQRPHNNLAVAMRPESLSAIAFHPDVRWVGAARQWQKIGPSLARGLAAEPAAASLLVWASLFESDVNPATERVRYGEAVPIGPGPFLPSPENPDPRPVHVRTHGWQERALSALGEVLEYSERNPAFLVRLAPQAVPLLADLDFVQVVDLGGGSVPAHDESTPMVHADYGRSFFSGATNQVAVVGEVDSGIYQPHADLNHLSGIGWDPAGGSDPWTDWCGHGSHVAGTILGNGSVDPGHTGNAPGLGWGGNGRVFNVKIFDSLCDWNGTTIQQAIGILRLPAASTPKPHAVSNSHGCPVGPPPYCGGPWDGTDQDAVDLDTAVYLDDQLWIFAAGNEGPWSKTIRREASAKNVLTVGNVSDRVENGQDPGEVTSDSSRGPTQDGRWKPNLCAPGHAITSVQSQTATGYTEKSGTSMATPHVTGVATQLVDAYSFLRYAPARLSSLLMTTALTRNDLVLSQPIEQHLRNYGTGRIDAMRALHATSQFGWTNWGFSLAAGQATYADFTVAPGATRLIVCMHYVEPPAAVGSGKALVSDFDLFLDQEPIDAALNVGDWFSQQSALDNTEIRSLNNPQVGQWRWKIWPSSTPAGAKFGLTVSVVYGDTTPDGTLVVSADKAFAKPNQDFHITATASNPAWIASAVVLDSSVTGGGWISQSSTTLIDGKVTSLIDNGTSGLDVLLGNIRPGTSRSANWTMRWSNEGWKTWTVDARSDNWIDKLTALDLGVDGTPPAAPGGFASMTHFTGVWSNQPNVTIVWTEPTDNLAGIEGYGWSASLGAPATPPAVQTLSTATLLTATLGSNAQGQYLNVRAVDKALNWGPAGSMGPFLIDPDPPAPGGTLISSTHASGVPSCNTTITMNWTAAFDALSGVAGYVGLWDFSPSTAPRGPANIAGSALAYTTTLAGSPSPRWFHLRPVDAAGNLGATKHAGWYVLDDHPITIYCTAKLNSQGCSPRIDSAGSPSISAGTFRVTASEVINQKNGILIWSLAQAATPFQGGFLCVAPPVFRTTGQPTGGNPLPEDCSGTLAYQWTTAYIQSEGLSAGQTVYSQYWSRDPLASFGSSLSNALSFTLCP